MSLIKAVFSSFLNFYIILFVARLVQAAARVGSGIRSSVRGEGDGGSDDRDHVKSDSVLKGISTIPNSEVVLNGGSGRDYIGNDEGLQEPCVMKYGGGADGKVMYSNTVWKLDQSSDFKSHEGQSDEDIITQAMRVVLTPLVDDVEEWNTFFRKTFSKEEHTSGQCASNDSEIKKYVCEVLLEWGYGEEEEEEEEKRGRQALGTDNTLNQVDSSKCYEGTVTNATLEDQEIKESIQLVNDLKSNQSSQEIPSGERHSSSEISDKGEATSTTQNTSNVQSRSKEDETGNGDILLGVADDSSSVNHSKSGAEKAGAAAAYNISVNGKAKQGESSRKGKLSSHGLSLLMAAMHLHSLLKVHHCCCLAGPSGAGKSTVWKVSNEVPYNVRHTI